MTDRPKQAWETLSEELLLDRPPFVRVMQERVRTDRGEVIDDYYRAVLPQFAVCVPVTKDGAVVTLWQYKHGPKAFSLTFPAGFIETGEAPGDAIRRELLEETGYRAEAMTAMGSFVDGGNQEGSTGHYFTASGCEAVQAPDDGDLETIEIRLMRPEEIDRALAEGRFAIGHHVIAWLLAARTMR